MKTILRIVPMCILFLCSCAQSPLDRALALAGENRAELEKVLTHYSSDPADGLKLKAAEFLISNMPAHASSSNPEYLEAYCAEIERSISYDSLASAKNKEVMEQISSRYDRAKLSALDSDLKLITAEYLIDNIERAFDVWEDGEWATHVSFDDFCEYILPYKGAEGQLLDKWREYSRPMFIGNLDTLHYADPYKNSVFHAATTICRQLIALNNQEYPTDGLNVFPILKIGTMAKMPLGTCGDYSLLAMAVMRSKGIPVVEDYTPQWPFQALGHSWNVLLDNNYKQLIFSAGSSNPGEVHKPDEKMAKIFRRTFAINEDVLAIHAAGKNVPQHFARVCIKDVTDEYLHTQDVDIEIPREFRGQYKYAYLAVFDCRNWVPIHYGKVSGRKVRFEKMGKNCVYLPVFYGESGVVPFAPPFRITGRGEIVRYDGISGESQTVVVRRKYFVGKHCYDVGRRLEGGIFQAANRPDFRDSVTIFRIPEFTVQSGEFDVPEQTGKYRYWRYLSAYRRHNNAAEIYFYQNDNPKPVYGKIIGTDGSFTGLVQDEKEVVFDNDPLTYYDAIEPSGSWVGMDFGEPVAISHIAYTPRGDGNDVTPGDTHELLYWQDNGWISLGRRQADGIKLAYENAPVGTLFWIRNLSRGKDERIFSYDNETQVWW